MLRRAIRDGNAPNLARWIHDGGHRLLRWETDWSSQTGACQAGLLHGDNDDMPAFRWWEKERGAAIVTNHPRDAAELERRHSNGRGLLHEDGASRANIVSGDAVHSLLTMSTVLDRDTARAHRPGLLRLLRQPLQRHPHARARRSPTSPQELRYAAQQRRRDVRRASTAPSSTRSCAPGPRSSSATCRSSAVIADIYAGRPVGYTTFLAYDEVAHHSGVERADALSVLRRVDRQIAQDRARRGRGAPRPYRFVVLSDHGQSQGATFASATAMSLEELVTRRLPGHDVEANPRTAGNDEARGMLGASLAEAGARGSPGAPRPGRATPPRGSTARCELGEARTAGARSEADDLPELSVMASGCLGLIVFPREPGG